MATDQDFIEYVHEQSGLSDALTFLKMFGEYALYFEGKVVAFACDNSLFLKPTDAGRVLLPRISEGSPYPGAKPYYVLDEFLDDTELLQHLIRTTADALPAPKPPKSKTVKAGAAKGRKSARKKSR